jgi:CheY-like chemotaxis protein
MDSVDEPRPSRNTEHFSLREQLIAGLQQANESLEKISQSDQLRLRRTAIVVVDDADTYRDVVTALRKLPELEVHHTSLQGARELLRVGVVQFALVDIDGRGDAPELDAASLSFVREMPQIRSGASLPPLPLILVASQRFMQFADLVAHEAGAVALLLKPVDASDLVELMGRLLNRH